jgi:hypothetical protein
MFASHCGIRWLASLAASTGLLGAGTGIRPGGGGWDRVLSAVGLGFPSVRPPIILLEGDGPRSRQLGFRATSRTVRVAQVEERRDPALEVIWQSPLTLPVFEIPPGARVFAREKWSGAPLVAGYRSEERAVLWTAAGVGEKGYERFPYLLHALADLGVEFRFRGARTWAVFDSSYRLRADPDFLARRWRRAGIAALHAAAWHFFEPDSSRDEYLKKLIEACHREGILVYAWLELPHVSERFWQDNPAWRERTAILQDAHLDWRKLMNLADPDCSDQVQAGVRAFLNRFDFDGVNLAELYFESLYGPSDPQRFTPMNETIRAEFRGHAGLDPIALFRAESPYFWNRNRDMWQRFVDYRAGLAHRLQAQWIEALRTWRPDLDLVLTHIDDRFDQRMREFLGADAAALLPLLERFPFTFAVEDPATVWHLGPERYAEIARRYAALTRRPDRLAVDINIVERYQDVYPTKKQTGTELLQLVHLASRSFPRVLLYFEHSIARADYNLLPAASAAVTRAEQTGDGLIVEAGQTTGVRWRGPAKLDGRPWPASDGEWVWVPAGRHRIESGQTEPPLRLLYLNADLLDAHALPNGVEFRYRSMSRAAALLNHRPSVIEVDGRPRAVPVLEAPGHFSLLLPAGLHTARLAR